MPARPARALGEDGHLAPERVDHAHPDLGGLGHPVPDGRGPRRRVRPRGDGEVDGPGRLARRGPPEQRGHRARHGRPALRRVAGAHAGAVPARPERPVGGHVRRAVGVVDDGGDDGPDGVEDPGAEPERALDDDDGAGPPGREREAVLVRGAGEEVVLGHGDIHGLLGVPVERDGRAPGEPDALGGRGVLDGDGAGRDGREVERGPRRAGDVVVPEHDGEDRVGGREREEPVGVTVPVDVNADVALELDPVARRGRVDPRVVVDELVLERGPGEGRVEGDRPGVHVVVVVVGEEGRALPPERLDGAPEADDLAGRERLVRHVDGERHRRAGSGGRVAPKSILGAVMRHEVEGAVQRRQVIRPRTAPPRGDVGDLLCLGGADVVRPRLVARLGGVP